MLCFSGWAHRYNFFRQGVKVSIACELEDMITLITISLFEVMLNNYTNKEYCHVSVKM